MMLTAMTAGPAVTFRFMQDSPLLVSRYLSRIASDGPLFGRRTEAAAGFSADCVRLVAHPRGFIDCGRPLIHGRILRISGDVAEGFGQFSLHLLPLLVALHCRLRRLAVSGEVLGLSQLIENDVAPRIELRGGSELLRGERALLSLKRHQASDIA